MTSLGPLGFDLKVRSADLVVVKLVAAVVAVQHYLVLAKLWGGFVDLGVVGQFVPSVSAVQLGLAGPAGTHWGRGRDAGKGRGFIGQCGPW